MGSETSEDGKDPNLSASETSENDQQKTDKQASAADH